LLQEAADRGILFEADGDFIGASCFGACTGASEQVCTRSPVWLVFSEPRIGTYIGHCLKSVMGAAHLCNRQRAIDGDDR
jgi:hypothetical protein